MPTRRRVLYVTPFALLPRTEGHRKRMAMTFDKFISEGFQVDVLFISREYDWSSLFNADTYRQLQSLGDVAHFVHAETPTPPIGEFYTVDEWWPSHANDYCRWLFENNGYEIIFCNYVFMSKVFEFCNRSAFKILDTHDLFSDRHKLLRANGLAPEFFYTDKYNEGLGLDRVDLAIAIKDEEAEYYRRISNPRVITLPHVEDLQSFRQVEPRDSIEGLVKFGFFGSQNSINVKNVLEFIRFLEEGAPSDGYPFEFWLYGSLCRRLKGAMPGYVKLGGMIKTTDEFYQNVDCVVNPQYFSTGLKIKIAEALAFGAPLISHRHSFEGFGAPLDKAHDCADFGEVLAAMMTVVADHRRLRELAVASRAVQRRQIAECDRQWERILKGGVAINNWLYFVVNVDCFNRVRFYRHLVELTFETFAKTYMICMVADTADDADSLWRVFKRKSNRFADGAGLTGVEAGAVVLVFDQTDDWRDLLAERDRVVVFDDAARMVAGHRKQTWRDWSGRVRPQWVMIRSDKGGASVDHEAIDVPVNYFRWLPWDMSVQATGDQYDLAPEVWVLTSEAVDPAWVAILDRALASRRLRLFGGETVHDPAIAVETWFDLFTHVFAQKTIPEMVVSLTHDPNYAPMKAWFAANAITVREYAPYAMPDGADPVQALSLPKLSEYSHFPERIEPREVVSPAWVGSGWRRFTALLASWAEADDASGFRD